MSSNQSASLYVGDLSFDVSESLLFETFNQVGPVASIRVCRDTLTRRSLGYAYVNFHNYVDAERALDTLNNTMILDKPCRIMWVQRDPAIRRSGLGNIFIKNLDPVIGHKELYDTFSIFGNILSCKVALDENAQSKGFGFVHFESAESAEFAVKTVNGKILETKMVFVGKFIPKKELDKKKDESWTNVYVKEIDTQITDEELRKIVAEKACDGNLAAITSCAIMKDENNVPRGFGFINFSKHELALKAVEVLHNTKVGEKTIWCGRAQKLEERQQELKKKFNLMKMERLSKYQGSNLYLKNLEDEVTEERLIKEFSPFGSIKSCKVVSDDQSGNKGFGFICFSSPEEAQRAITEMHSRILQGCNKPLYVALHEPAEIRKQKIAQRNNAKMRMNYFGGSQGIYGQPVFYGPNVYPQMGRQQQPGWMYNNNSQRGRMNTYKGGRGPRRHNPTHTNQAKTQKPVIAPVMAIQQILGLPAEQQTIALGERLYPLIYKLQPVLCGKITGMFLDSGWSVEELFGLIEDEQKLTQKVKEAMEVLDVGENQTTLENIPHAITVED